MKTAIFAFGEALLNLIYPATCYICRKKLSKNVGLCNRCISKIYKNNYGISACRYEGVIKEAICIFKYKNGLPLLSIFAAIITEFVDKTIDTSQIDIIIPIPLHSVKLRERGFNQAYLISKAIAKKYNIPISTGNLVKMRPTMPQSSLNKNQRLKNLKGVFAVKRPEYLRKKRVLLVDDVYTTGTTINMASEVLKKAGVKTIKAITLAGSIL